ncbi:hypothetical protein KAFR_0C06280 [Kazachstania africana CBS 2517]|uniref:Agglutinin-like protein N-terminal domain-containing protein n=1 Tax=Kazachstania africana (strain ATCC 22294 / BCRC 22015 / CBS 2517 / CECT 1963 / NBRC 1671 / NRRL Y-8276) TaxID=1071382 RepID=H2ATC4_KAZAF|nr:hypothetical protein KAFR_0C06280 [Kazachstania africana CBS 2517]CCF57624.1 hypothetical protein KAFR_0C06280 [Kazachstania africana CBS 2517]
MIGKKILQLFYISFTFLLIVKATEISDITFANLSVIALSEAYPHLGWEASFDFSIEDASTIKQGDTFTLNLEHVYRLLLNGDNSSNMTISLDDGTDIFNCYVAQQAAYLYPNTIFVCEAIGNFSAYSLITGNITFGLTFSSGDSAYEYELEGANYYENGTTTVSFGDQMSTDIIFDSSSFDMDFYFISRTTSYDSIEVYYLGMNCPSGHLVGGTETIDFDSTDEGLDIDCSSVQVYVSNEFNDWWLPKSYNETDADTLCFDDTLMISVGESKPEDMLFVNVLQTITSGATTVLHDINMQYTCMDTTYNTTYVTSISTYNMLSIKQGYQAAAAAARNIAIETSSIPITSTTTTGWTGSYTTTYSTESTFVTGSNSETTPEIVYHVETPSTELVSTTTTGWTGSYTTTYSTESTFVTGSNSETTPEIVYHVETPSTELVSTTTTGWTGSYTTTYSTESTFVTGSNSETTPEIVYHVETPSTELVSTTTTGWTGSYTTTYSTESTFVTGSNSETTPEIVYHVETPSTSMVSSTSSSSINTTTLSTVLSLPSSSSITITSSNRTSSVLTSTPGTSIISTISNSLSTVSSSKSSSIVTPPSSIKSDKTTSSTIVPPVIVTSNDVTTSTETVTTESITSSTTTLSSGASSSVPPVSTGDIVSTTTKSTKNSTTSTSSLFSRSQITSESTYVVQSSTSSTSVPQVTQYVGTGNTKKQTG